MVEHGPEGGAHEGAAGHGVGGHGGGHGADAHGAGAPDDPHAAEHIAEPLGPLDMRAWGAGAVAVAIGLITALVFFIATAHVAG